MPCSYPIPRGSYWRYLMDSSNIIVWLDGCTIERKELLLLKAYLIAPHTLLHHTHYCTNIIAPPPTRLRACALSMKPRLLKMSALRYVVRRSFFHPFCCCNRFACSMAEGKDPSNNGGVDNEDMFAQQLLTLPEEVSTKREVCTRCK